MQNGQITLTDLFDGRKIFVIPPFQRSYAWEERQLEEFARDFENQVIHKAYFFGTVLFREASKQGAFETIEIVDGQQRLTTLVIYLHLILDRLKAAEEETELLINTFIRYGGRVKLQLQPDDNQFFEDYILQEHDGSSMINTPAQKRLWAARQLLRKRVAGYSLDKMKELLDKIDRTRVLIYSVQDSSEATLIFEVTNDRGKSLSNLEKIKAFLMHKTYLASPDAEHDLLAIQSHFVEIYRDLEPILDRYKSMEDAILQYHYIAYEKWWASRNEKENYANHVTLLKQAIDVSFYKPDHAATMAYIKKYTRELRETYAVMKHLLLEPEKYGLLDLMALGRQAVFYPLLIKAYQLDQSEGRREFQRVVRLMEIISFRVWGALRKRSNTGHDRLYALARDFRGNFNQLVADLKGMISEYASDSEFRSRLLDPYLYNRFSAGDLRYLYWKYENYLRGSESPRAAEMSYAEFAANDPKVRLSIEHIYPQNPQQLRVIQDQSILAQSTKEFQERWLHSLGNLTLDPLKANMEKSNHDFEIKNSRFFCKAPYKTQNELDTFMDPAAPRWDENAIARRRDKILQFALQNWKYQDI